MPCAGSTIDVWPQDLTSLACLDAAKCVQPTTPAAPLSAARTSCPSAFLSSTTALFMLQLATVLIISPAWRRKSNHFRLRVNVCIAHDLSPADIAHIQRAVSSALSDIRVNGWFM